MYSNPGIYTGTPLRGVLDRYINAVRQVGVGRGNSSLRARRGERFPPIHVRKTPRAPLLGQDGRFSSSAKEAVRLTRRPLPVRTGCKSTKNTIVPTESTRRAIPCGSKRARGNAPGPNALIVAAGAWARELLPFLKSRLTISRAGTVGYFTPARRAGSLPARPFPRLGCIWNRKRTIFSTGCPEFGARRHQGGPAHESRGG